MQYTDYEELAKDLTPDNALDTVKTMLEKLKADTLTDEAQITAMQTELEQTKQKYKDLQVDYIQKFIGASGSEAEEEDTEAQAEAELKEALTTISDNMN